MLAHCVARSSVALVALAVGCAAVLPAPRTTTAPALVADLSAALPPGSARGDHAQTGDPARVVLGARRERAAELYLRYLRRIADHDEEGLRALFADPVIDTDTGEARSRDEELHLHERALQSDPGGLASAIDNVRPVVRSFAELRRPGHSAPPWMRADDWFVEVSPRDLPIAFAQQLPRRFIVRWEGDQPVFVGASRMNLWR